MAHLGCMSSQSPGKGGLSGIVTDTSGNPLSGVKITAPEGSALSDVNGKWTLSALSAQMTQVTAARENFQSQNKTVEVLSGETKEGVNFTLAANSEIYDVSVSGLTSSNVTITFYTKKQATAYIKYGPNNLLQATTPKNTESTFMHTFTIQNLIPATTYNFVCVANDTLNRTIESELGKFTTAYTIRGNPPTGLKISKLTSSNVIKIDWNADTGTDFSGYKIYRAESAAGPFVELAKMTQNTHSDMDVSPGVKYFYRITRLAGTGEESPPSDTISFLMPGVMNRNAVWTSQNSPYLLTGDLKIAPGFSLVIDKGVSVGVSAADEWDKETADDRIEITVQGTLMVQGTASEPVSFNSTSGSPQAGDWVGIIFDTNSDLTTSLIKGLNLACAVDGLYGIEGLPSVSDSRFFNCRQSGLQCLKSRRAVDILNVVADTCGSGIMVKDSSVDVKITNSKAIRCIYGIVCRNNTNAQVTGNIVQFAGVAGLDLGNNSTTSKAMNNIVGYGSNGSAVILRGKDELRRNTLQAGVGIELKGDANSIIRSNLILSDNSRSAIGVLYSGTVTDSSGKVTQYNYSVASHTIQNNDIWDIPTGNARRYSNYDGTALTGISSDLTLDPSLQGGTPFVEFPTSTFNYTPSPGSSLKGAGYDFEDVGAINVPD